MLPETSVIQMQCFQHYHPQHENLSICSADSQASISRLIQSDNSDLNSLGNPFWHILDNLNKEHNATLLLHIAGRAPYI